MDRSAPVGPPLCPCLMLQSGFSHARFAQEAKIARPLRDPPPPFPLCVLAPLREPTWTTTTKDPHCVGHQGVVESPWERLVGGVILGKEEESLRVLTGGRRESPGTDTGATWQGDCPARVGSDGEACGGHSGPGTGEHGSSARTLGTGRTARRRDAPAPTGQPVTARGGTPGPPVPNDPRPEWARGPGAISPHLNSPIGPRTSRSTSTPLSTRRPNSASRTSSAAAEPTRPPRARSITVRVRAGRSKWNSWSTGPEGRSGQFEDGYVRLPLTPDGHRWSSAPFSIILPHQALTTTPYFFFASSKVRQRSCGGPPP